MRGYFAVGTDGLSKPMNLGNLLRISHAFGASFFFTISGRVRLADAMRYSFLLGGNHSGRFSERPNLGELQHHVQEKRPRYGFS